MIYLLYSFGQKRGGLAGFGLFNLLLYLNAHGPGPLVVSRGQGVNRMAPAESGVVYHPP
jgi:hypothetical protein